MSNIPPPPDDYLCIINLDLMSEPWVTPCGHCGEQEALLEWLKANKTCPKCRKELRPDQLNRNLPLRNIIRNYADNNGIDLPHVDVLPIPTSEIEHSSTRTTERRQRPSERFERPQRPERPSTRTTERSSARTTERPSEHRQRPERPQQSIMAKVYRYIHMRVLRNTYDIVRLRSALVECLQEIEDVETCSRDTLHAVMDSFMTANGDMYLLNVKSQRSPERRVQETPEQTMRCCAYMNDIGGVRQSLQNGASPDAYGRLVKRSLTFAIENNNVDIVRLLLAFGASPNKLENDIISPICSAFMKDDINPEIILSLFEFGCNDVTDCMTVDEKYIYPLMMSAQKDWVDIAKKLLDIGLNIYPYNFDPLKLAARNNSCGVARLLLERGAQHRTTVDGISPLHSAVHNKNIQMVEILLNNNNVGKDINATSIYGTPLHIAAFTGYRDIVELLLQFGAAIDVLHDDETPLYNAVCHRHVDVVRALCSNFYNRNVFPMPNRVSMKIKCKGMTALYKAAYTGQTEIARILLRNGADVDDGHNDGTTPLHAAARKGHGDIVRILLDYKADPDKKVNGQTALQLARINGYQSIVNVLRPVTTTQKTCAIC